MLQLLLLAAVVYFLYRWLRRDDAPAETKRTSASPGHPVEEMVQDLQCGTWVPASQAIILKRGGEALYFCSPECRDKYLKEASNRDA
ncbi:MAG: hypothetical protein JXO51_03730 [Candidatus Aminicenantes bacterium]|nr:hypothetical protein [Candidatus Aminicenantes bacterium]